MNYANENALRMLKKRSRLALALPSHRNADRIEIYGVELVYICFTGIVAAFIGWIAENSVKLISSGVVDSRFHILPFISPYALVPAALHVLLGDPDDLTVFGKKVFARKTKSSKAISNLFSLVVICLTVFLGEFTVGNLWERLFGVRLWDYSSQPLHLTQYVSILSATGYGVGAFLLFKYVFRPFTLAIRNRMSYEVASNLCLTLGTLIVADTLIMFAIIAATGSAPVYWSLSF